MEQFSETQLRDYAEKLMGKFGEEGAAEYVATAGYDKQTTETLMKMIRGSAETDRDSAMATDGDLDDYGQAID